MQTLKNASTWNFAKVIWKVKVWNIDQLKMDAITCNREWNARGYKYPQGLNPPHGQRVHDLVRFPLYFKGKKLMFNLCTHFTTLLQVFLYILNKFTLQFKAPKSNAKQHVERFEGIVHALLK